LRSASTTATAASTRSRIAAPTTTARSAKGEWETDECIAICPRHGARFDITSGAALTLPAFQPVDTFPVRVEDGWVRVEV
jgi:nitrite reductase/ring-hydroxylating ferredoxin subunit